MSHPYKRIKLRISRTMEQLFELQGISEKPQENDVIEHCVGIMQRAQAAVHTAIVAAERSAKQKPRAASPVPAAARRTGVVPAPVPAGREGVTDAAVRQPKTWAGRELVRPRQGDDDAGMTVVRHDSTPAEYVQQCLDDLRGVHDGMAARQLAESTVWATMTDEQRMSGIKALSLEMALADTGEDLDAEATTQPAADADGTKF